MPTLLHTTAKCARIIIESEEEDPLGTLKGGKTVDIGNPDLGHLGSECNVSLDWESEAMNASHTNKTKRRSIDRVLTGKLPHLRSPTRVLPVVDGPSPPKTSTRSAWAPAGSPE